MRKVDIVSFKMYSYDADYFNNEVMVHYKNSILIYFDFNKVWVEYKPRHIEFKKGSFNLFMPKTGNKNLDYYLLTVVMTINLIKIFWFISAICFKFRPRVLFVEHTYVAILGGMLKVFKLCKKSIYVTNDWVANDKNKKRLLGYIHCNVVFPLLDFVACKLNDLVINFTVQIAEARNKFWGKKIAKREKPHSFKPKIAVDENLLDNKSNNLCFLGNMREDSGLDIAIKSLSKIRNTIDSNLIIIGEKTQHYEYFKRLSKQYNVEAYVKFLGFVKTDQFKEILSKCFCGINILTSLNSYSDYGIPGKQIHYLQHLLPVIVTEGSGIFVSVIKDSELGIVIEPTKDAFIEAVFKIYEQQKEYRGNIIRHIESLPKIDIKELIEG